MGEPCSICGCSVHRKGEYARATVKGRSHATWHHLIAKRFFGRKANKRSGKIDAIFERKDWEAEQDKIVLCYDCHEVLLHNPIFLKKDLDRFRMLIKDHGFNETKKTESTRQLAGRIVLLHEIIEKGLEVLDKRTSS